MNGIFIGFYLGFVGAGSALVIGIYAAQLYNWWMQ